MSMSPRHPVDPVDDRAEAPAPASPSRRRFVRNVGLGAAALGAAAATGATLTGTASAQTAAATTPPDLSPSDVALVQFLQSISLAGEEGLATAAAKPGAVAASLNEEIRTFSRNHGAQAKALGALLSTENAITAANPKLLAQLDGQISGAADQVALLAVLLKFEEQVAATMLQAMSDAQSWLVATPVAAALPVVGQQAAALGSAAGTPIADWLPAFGTTDGALTPAAFPAR